MRALNNSLYTLISCLNTAHYLNFLSLDIIFLEECDITHNELNVKEKYLHGMSIKAFVIL
jgi:hypothetical protein